MSQFPNSSSSVERFTLAAGENKTFISNAPGGNLWEVDVTSDNQETATAVVALQTSEDGTSFTTVSTVTVVPAGYAATSGSTGRYAKIINSGSGIAYVVAKAARIVQTIPSL